MTQMMQIAYLGSAQDYGWPGAWMAAGTGEICPHSPDENAEKYLLGCHYPV
jgi:hypothetical protein